jgi:hypothetical protein
MLAAAFVSASDSQVDTIGTTNIFGSHLPLPNAYIVPFPLSAIGLQTINHALDSVCA